MASRVGNAITLGQGAQEAGGVVLWVIALIVAALVGGLVILAVRRKMLEPEQSEVASDGLFDSLRRMRDTGEITSGEYENARRRLIESATQKKEEGPRLTKDQAAILSAAGIGKGGEGAGREARTPRMKDLDAPPGYDLTGDPLPRRPAGPPGPGSGRSA